MPAFRFVSAALFIGLLGGAVGRLAIVNAVVQQTEDGSAAPANPVFVPGETLFLSFQIEGYHVSPERKIRVGYQVDAFDFRGVRLIETIESNIDTDLTAEDKNWKPKVRHTILIPPLAESGTYKIAIRVKDDLLTDVTASKDVTFEVRGHEVAPGEGLVVRNFRFLRAEEDRDPLPTPAYRPGDTVWARFDISGYKFGDGNEVHVDYGIAVASPDGKILFSQPEAAVEQSSSFYPKRYVPGVMNLSLQPKIRPGKYAIILTVRDHIGKQTIEEKQHFSIE